MNLLLKPNPSRRIYVEPRHESELSPLPAVANGLICPLSWKPFTDPVIAPNGVTYNADAIHPYIINHGHLPQTTNP